MISMNVNRDTLIEGIGDEVLVVIAVLLVVVIVFLVWISKDLHFIPICIRQFINSNREVTNQRSETIEVAEETQEVKVDPDIFTENKITEINETLESEYFPASGDNINNSNKEADIPPGYISVKLKYLDDRTKTIHIDPQATISDFKRDNFQDDLSNNKNVRLIYNGKELKELNGESTLAGYGVLEDSTIHCLVTQKRETVTATPSSVTEISSMSELNMGSLMFPLFGVLLSLIWYYRLNYKHHFNIASTFVLVSLTGIYFVACFVNYSTAYTMPPSGYNGASGRSTNTTTNTNNTTRRSRQQQSHPHPIATAQ